RSRTANTARSGRRRRTALGAEKTRTSRAVSVSVSVSVYAVCVCASFSGSFSCSFSFCEGARAARSSAVGGASLSKGSSPGRGAVG
ncbi:MAG: hypothetical protein NC237_02140, partial [Eubacterium sp.]|nr:hypothetical protein [Eubacterium sp.]